MNLEKIEKKFRKNCRLGTACESGSSGFILSDGSVIPMAGQTHDNICKNMGLKLADALEAGICRYLFRVGQQGNVAVFEYSFLTPEQKNAIRKMLKADDYYMVTIMKTVIDRHRPIRSLNF